MPGNLPRSVNPLVLSLGRHIATGASPISFVRTALDSTLPAPSGSLAPSSASMTRTTSPERGWDWRPFSGSFIDTAAAFGRKAPLREVRHSILHWRQGKEEPE